MGAGWRLRLLVWWMTQVTAWRGRVRDQAIADAWAVFARYGVRCPTCTGGMTPAVLTGPPCVACGAAQPVGVLRQHDGRVLCSACKAPPC